MSAIKTNVLDNKVLENSFFTHLFTKNGASCLLHSLTLNKVYGGNLLRELNSLFSQPRQVTEVIDQLSVNYSKDLLVLAITDLWKQGLLISDGEIDLKDYIWRYNQGVNQYSIQNMYFLPTNACNLRCKYCFIEDSNRPFTPSYMTQDIAEKGLRVFAKLTENADNINMTFYGGEPLLNADVVYHSMRYVRELQHEGAFKRPVNMSLLTNGVLADDKTIEAVLETKTIVSVSIDGPGVLNRARKDIKGNDTFDKALAGYRRFQDAGIGVGISCTLSRFNVEHITEITEFIVNDLKPTGMGFNILLPTINGGNPVDIDPEFTTNQLIEAFKILREAGIYEDRMMRRCKPYMDGGFHLKDCMGVGGQIALTPDGMIGPCQVLLGVNEFFPLDVNVLYSKLDSISSEDIYKDALFNEWRYRFPLNMKKCADCFAIAICGGGCPYAAYANHGSIWEIDDRVCYQSKQILEWMLWDTYDRMVENQDAGTVTDVPQVQLE